MVVGVGIVASTRAHQCDTTKSGSNSVASSTLIRVKVAANGFDFRGPNPLVRVGGRVRFRIRVRVRATAKVRVKGRVRVRGGVVSGSQ